MGDKLLYKRTQEVDGRFFHLENSFPSIVFFMSDSVLSSLHEAVTETRETFGKEHETPSPGRVVSPVLVGAVDNEGKCNFGNIPRGSSSGRKHHHRVHSKMQGLVILGELRTTDYGLGALSLTESCWHDCPILMELC